MKEGDDKVADKKEGIVVSFGSLVEGVGKTTNSTMIAYSLSKIGYKVLLIDQDPRADATILYLMTKANTSMEIHDFDMTLMTAIRSEELEMFITEVKDNLFLLPSSSNFALYPRFLENKFSDERDRVQYFSSLVEPLKENYDFIFIDVPSMMSIITESAFYASNFVVMILKTDEKVSLQLEDFTRYLSSLIDKYEAAFEIMGILPVSLINGESVIVDNFEETKKLFGEEYFFKNRIDYTERLKRFIDTGITDEDTHDKKIHEKYQKVVGEFIFHLNRELQMKAISAEGFDMQDLENNLKLEEVEREKTSATVKKFTRYKLNALSTLSNTDTLDHLIDRLIENHINNNLKADEKKKFDLFFELYKTKG